MINLFLFLHNGVHDIYNNRRIKVKIPRRLSPSVVCEGFWQRNSPCTTTDITSRYYLSRKDWYGVESHETSIKFADGNTKLFKGTYRSRRFIKLAVKADGSTPTGTMTCNHCARVPTLYSFVKAMERCSPAKTKTRNDNLSRKCTLVKLKTQAKKNRLLRQAVGRHVQRKRTTHHLCARSFGSG